LIVDIGSVRHVRKFLTEKPVFSRQKNQNFKSLQTGFKHLHKQWGVFRFAAVAQARNTQPIERKAHHPITRKKHT
jgi:hypothetical protein